MATKRQNGEMTDEQGNIITTKPDQTALAKMESPSGSIATVRPDTMPLGSMDGDIDDVTEKLPFLEISHAQGRFEDYKKGVIMLGGEHQLTGNVGDPVRITILSTRVFWKEYTSGPYDPDYIPKTYINKQDAITAGETIEWRGSEPPTVKIAAMSKVLIQRPKNLICGLFGIPLGGLDIEGEGKETTWWAPALWSVDKTAAASVTPVIKSDLRFSLRERGLLSGIYELTTRIQTFKSGNKAAVPQIKLVNYHSNEVVAQLEQMFGGFAE